MAPEKRNLERLDIYVEPEFKNWLRIYSRSRGYHTITAYIRHLLTVERERIETEEERKGGKE